MYRPELGRVEANSPFFAHLIFFNQSYPLSVFLKYESKVPKLISQLIPDVCASLELRSFDTLTLPA